MLVIPNVSAEMSVVDVQNGETPLLAAAGRGNVEIVRLLLEAHPRADVNKALSTVGAHQRLRQYRPSLGPIVDTTRLMWRHQAAASERLLRYSGGS